MSGELRLAYFAHSLRSDWNNGNAHFLRGLLREMGAVGHEVAIFEPENEWSISNLREEIGGAAAITQFREAYPELRIRPYTPATIADRNALRKALGGFDIVLVHEWNPPALSHALLELRSELGYRILFHDTHHRASSSPEQIRLFGVDRFDGVVVFGDVLRTLYQRRFGITRVWTLHEAADTRVFTPQKATAKHQDIVWIGNWGDEERSVQIREFLLRPADEMRDRRFAIYGVRYPEEAKKALCAAGVRYGGYLPNLDAPRVYAQSRVTVHVPRQQYANEMTGIPTIRVFEALACGIPLISAPWSDTEELFGEEDILFVSDGMAMRKALTYLLERPERAAAQVESGRETILRRHTCTHRAAELSAICEEVLE